MPSVMILPPFDDSMISHLNFFPPLVVTVYSVPV